MTACSHQAAIQDVVPSAKGCEECLRTGDRCAARTDHLACSLDDGTIAGATAKIARQRIMNGLVVRLGIGSGKPGQ